MKVLVACEESQRVCIELRRLGNEAYSCDIESCSGGHPEWHIRQDVIPLLDGNCRFLTVDGMWHRVYGKWDMIIAFPPCTYMTKAGAVRMRVRGEISKERYQKAIAAKEFKGNYRRFQGRKERNSKNRSKTFPGIAKAMADQWAGKRT